MKPWSLRLLVSTIMCALSFEFAPTKCGADLLPPGDFNGKSLNQWTLDWDIWGTANGLGGQSLPDTVDGVRYLPPNFGGGDFVTSLMIQPGTAVFVSPFFVNGEMYDDGSADNPADPIIDTIFEETTFKMTLDGEVVLEGLASDFPQRRVGVTTFPAPVPYTDPQPRGAVNAVSAIFGTGIGTIFDNLSVGEHTLRNEFDSSFFGAATFTYNITVVPEPPSLATAGVGALALLLISVPMRACRTSSRRRPAGS